MDVIGVGIDSKKKVSDLIFSSDFDFDRRFFYRFSEVSESVALSYREIAEKIIKILNLKGIFRIDARINDKHEVFINDINSSPGISRKSTFDFFFNQHGLSLNELYLLLLASAFGADNY